MTTDNERIKSTDTGRKNSYKIRFSGCKKNRKYLLCKVIIIYVCFPRTNDLLLYNSPTYTDKELLRQVAEGDETAFKHLYLQWHQLLAGYVFRITESRVLTEEIVQDVFMNIWRVRETLAEINNFKHFLLVVSRNRAFDVLKKQLKEHTI